LLQKLQEAHPTILGLIDNARFGLQGPEDLAQAAITPMVRQSHAHLGNSKSAIALGDTHVTVDPLMAQGASIGSYSAFTLADAIAQTNSFDLTFCGDLQPLDDARMGLIIAMSGDRRLAREYYDIFDRPGRQWERICSAEHIRAWPAEDPTHAGQLAAVTANS
jgi:hypothetical protein